MMTQIAPRDGEKVLFVVRKSFLKLTRQIIKFVLLVIIGGVMFFVSTNEYLTLLAAAILLFALAYAFYFFLIWFYDIYIITDQRIICADQKGIFSREFSEIELNNIKEVTYSIRGVLATIFRFGLVTIKGNDQKMELSYLPDPDEFHEMIQKLSLKAKKEKGTNSIAADDIINLLKKSEK